MSPTRAPNATAAAASTRPDLVMSARGLDLSFGTTHALRGIDLDIAVGQSLAVTGPSGSGKSTLMHVLAGILRPDAGSVLYDGRDIASLGESERSQLRLSSFGFVFQFGQLLPDLSALDNVTIPLLLAKVPRATALERSRALLAELDLEGHEHKLPTQLSGGQAQRVAVARALVTEPRILFADEPTGALDSLSAEHTMQTLVSATRAAGAALVMVTHDPRTAAYCDREVIVRDGRLSGSCGTLDAPQEPVDPHGPEAATHRSQAAPQDPTAAGRLP